MPIIPLYSTAIKGNKNRTKQTGGDYNKVINNIRKQSKNNQLYLKIIIVCSVAVILFLFIVIVLLVINMIGISNLHNDITTIYNALTFE